MAFYFIKDTTLTDIANAIREKSGTEEKLNAGNFAEEIRKIEGGDIIINGDNVASAPVAITLPIHKYCYFFENLDDEGKPAHMVMNATPNNEYTLNMTLRHPTVGGYIVFMVADAYTNLTPATLSVTGDVTVYHHNDYSTIIQVTGTGGGTINIT